MLFCLKLQQMKLQPLKTLSRVENFENSVFVDMCGRLKTQVFEIDAVTGGQLRFNNNKAFSSCFGGYLKKRLKKDTYGRRNF